MNVTARNVLRNSGLFSEFSGDEADLVAHISRLRDVPAGQPIFFEGDKALGFFIVAEGMVKVYQLSGGGKEHILHIFGEGEAFAEAAAFNGGTFPASAMALSDSKVLFISIREFSKIIISRPRLGMKVISSLSMLLHTLVGKISELTLSDAQSRLAKYLLEGVKTTASGPAIELSITKSALATELNIKLETLSRLFARLKKKRLISVNKGRIVLIDPDRVRMVAVGELKI